MTARSRFWSCFIILQVFAMSTVAHADLVGQKAPALGIEKFLQAPEGDKSLQALKGKVIVLEFWATWCAPCVAEIPHLNRLNDEFRDKPVQFISVTNENEDVIVPFLKRKEMKSWIGLDTDKSMHKAYGVKGIPRTFLIDREGKVAASLHPSGLSSAMIEKVIRGEEIKLPKAPRSIVVESRSINVEGDGEEPILKISITPTEKKGGSSSSSTSKGFKKMEAESMTLRQALSTAYEFPSTRVMGPEALLESRYAVSIKLPREQFNLLFQQALNASLQLRVSNGQKSVEVLVLTAGEGSAEKLTPTIMGSSGSQSGAGPGRLMAINGDMRSLARSLEYVLKRVVIDGTGIEGKYDWELIFDKDDPNSVLKVLGEKLGLEVQTQQRNIEFLMVDDQDVNF